MRLIRTVLAATMLSSSISLAQADLKVVASIKPIHSLVAAVMEGVGLPILFSGRAMTSRRF